MKYTYFELERFHRLRWQCVYEVRCALAACELRKPKRCSGCGKASEDLEAHHLDLLPRWGSNGSVWLVTDNDTERLGSACI